MFSCVEKERFSASDKKKLSINLFETEIVMRNGIFPAAFYAATVLLLFNSLSRSFSLGSDSLFHFV
jgi:hypothetical protein